MAREPQPKPQNVLRRTTTTVVEEVAPTETRPARPAPRRSRDDDGYDDDQYDDDDE